MAGLGAFEARSSPCSSQTMLLKQRIIFTMAICLKAAVNFILPAPLAGSMMMVNRGEQHCQELSSERKEPDKGPMKGSCNGLDSDSR